MGKVNKDRAVVAITIKNAGNDQLSVTCNAREAKSERINSLAECISIAAKNAAIEFANKNKTIH